MTFSIAAYHAEEQTWGVAVASKFLAVGSVVSWAQADAGAVATQSFAKFTFGPDGLRLMAAGLSAKETLAQLIAADDNAQSRQVGFVDKNGQAAAFTGKECFDYAGHIIGEGFTCQGNILVGPQVLEGMAAAFRTTQGALVDKLMAALTAGDKAGGDRRGRQSAAIYIAKRNGGYGGDNDRLFDLRVDDHPDPVTKLAELVALNRLYFEKSNPASRLPIEGALAHELQTLLTRQGYYTGPLDGLWDKPSQDAFWALVGVENLEERWSLTDQPDRLDPVVLNFLRTHFGKVD